MNRCEVRRAGTNAEETEGKQKYREQMVSKNLIMEEKKKSLCITTLVDCSAMCRRVETFMRVRCADKEPGIRCAITGNWSQTLTRLRNTEHHDRL